MIRLLPLIVRLRFASAVRRGGAWLAETIAPEIAAPRALRVPRPPYTLRVTAALILMAVSFALDVAVALLDAAAAALTPEHHPTARKETRP